jgi:CubicO group peptidase (beta-lactamase class C family)
MKNFLLISVFFVLALTFLSCDKDDNDPVVLPQTITTPTELTAALNEIYDDTDAPGFAVSVVKNNTLLYQQSFGKADIEGNKSYTNQTTQPIGSISKTFVAAAVVKAIEQGHFTLETDINEILPFEVKNPKMPNTIIRVKDLVTHTSGLLDNYEVYFDAYHILPGEDLSTEGAQLLLNGFGIDQREDIPLGVFLSEYYLEDGSLYSVDNFAPTAPGSTWSYSNIATSLTAYLIEVASGVPFKEYVSTNILQPLEMSRTAYDVADLNAANVAKLYWDKNTPFPLYSNDSYPDGSLYTCNEDLSKYLMDMMKGAKGQSTTLFSKEGYDLLFDALLPDGILPTGLAENQGIFWFLEDGSINHDGSDPGNTCNLQFDKNANAGYFLLTNMDASTDEHEIAYFELAVKAHNAIQEFIQAN